MAVTVKICGINSPDAMAAAVKGGAAMVGLMFYPPSPRFLSLDYAAALLRSGEDRNVTEIVFDSGFEDVSHFSKAFRNRFGKSPTAYRAEKIPGR